MTTIIKTEQIKMSNLCIFTAVKLPSPFEDTYIVSCKKHGTIQGIFSKNQKYSYNDAVEINKGLYCVYVGSAAAR